MHNHRCTMVFHPKQICWHMLKRLSLSVLNPARRAGDQEDTCDQGAVRDKLQRTIGVLRDGEWWRAMAHLDVTDSWSMWAFECEPKKKNRGFEGWYVLSLLQLFMIPCHFAVAPIAQLAKGSAHGCRRSGAGQAARQPTSQPASQAGRQPASQPASQPPMNKMSIIQHLILYYKRTNSNIHNVVYIYIYIYIYTHTYIHK